MDVLAVSLAVILFLLGFVGTLVPVMPGVLLIYAGMILYGWLTGFAGLSTEFYIYQGLAVILVFAVDYLATAAGSRRFGGSKRALWGSVLGILLGVVILGPIGIILGPFLGAVAGELTTGKELNGAMKAGLGALLGFMGGVFIKLLIEAAMIAAFFIAIFAG